MTQYSLRSISLSDFGRHAMLTITASFMAGASAATREAGIQNLAKLHGIDLRTTKSLRYDPTLKKDGTNLKGDIHIGPGAFSQDYHWLAAVVFHEIVHSDQFEFYAQHNVNFVGQAPKSEAERRLVALDECEGFYWPWRNSRALELSTDQQNELQREVQLWFIEIDDSKTVDLANKGLFDDARLALISRRAAEAKNP